ncbi:hypothetical protein [Mesorhizobium sp. 2RAF21]|uniref:hypothetical protein n=1 Tax=Mesorhizobium sp. 2RAF21 TaxID=3232995 RepID=UPI003F989F68
MRGAIQNRCCSSLLRPAVPAERQRLPFVESAAPAVSSAFPFRATDTISPKAERATMTKAPAKIAARNLFIPSQSKVSWAGEIYLVVTVLLTVNVACISILVRLFVR